MADPSLKFYAPQPKPDDQAIRIVNHEGRTLVTIRWGGAIEYDSADLDEAAQLFWDAIGRPGGTPAPNEPDSDEVLLVRLDGRKSGRVTIGHTRLPVTTILELLRAGDSPDLIAAAYPTVTAGQLRVLDQLWRDLDEESL